VVPAARQQSEDRTARWTERAGIITLLLLLFLLLLMLLGRLSTVCLERSAEG
jgi:hypothetical protein